MDAVTLSKNFDGYTTLERRGEDQYWMLVNNSGDEFHLGNSVEVDNYQYTLNENPDIEDEVSEALHDVDEKYASDLHTVLHNFPVCYGITDLEQTLEAILSKLAQRLLER